MMVMKGIGFVKGISLSAFITIAKKFYSNQMKLAYELFFLRDALVCTFLVLVCNTAHIVNMKNDVH